MPTAKPRAGARPSIDRNAIMRVAGDLIGSEKLARDLGISPRTTYAMMAGKRRVSDAILGRTRQLLIERRQRTGMLIRVIRVEEGSDEDR